MTARALARRIGAAGLAAAGLTAAMVTGGAAQDFAPATPSAVAAGPAALLDGGLPLAPGGIQVETVVTRWFGIPGLETRHLAFGAGWRGARLALGISQTGDPEIGWSALGAAAGGASRAAGAAVRAVARHDRARPGLAGSAGPGAGIEIGAGTWARAGDRVLLHASAPQLLARGEAPPLARGLELGATLRLEELSLWLVQRSPPGAAAVPEHELGATLALPPLKIWASARDHPPRGAVGVRASAGAFAIGATVESHPVLGETARIGVALARGTPP